MDSHNLAAKPIFCLFFSLAALLLASPARAGDLDPLQDFRVADLRTGADAVNVNGFPCKPAAAVTSDDFFFAGLRQEGNTSNIFGSSVIAANVATFSGLNTLGLSVNHIDIEVGGIVVPHNHPRATELIILLKGRTLVGFVSTSNNTLYSKILNPREMFMVPKGPMHFQYNADKEQVLALTAFDSQLPGVVLAPTALFGFSPAISDDVLARAFQVDRSVVIAIKSKFGN